MRVSAKISRAFAAAAAFIAVGLSTAADAQYFRRPVSEIDPKIMLIDEQAVLGAQMNAETSLVDANGQEFKWGDALGTPIILVLSYYSCDGSCSVINQSLASLLPDVKNVAAGTDYKIVTLSFDRHDDAKSAGTFTKKLQIPASVKDHWTFATFKSEADLKSETAKIGFKFFWSPEDRIFLHPGAFLFFSPKGRLIRVLYQQDVSARDIELAVLDAREGQFRPTELIKYALSICYSYSYHDGRYVMSIPIFVGFGALAFGLLTLFGSLFVYTRYNRPKGTGEIKHVEAV
jgi:protein SCO1/2